MDLKEIKKILDLIAESEVNEVTIEEGEFKIKVKKKADVIQGAAPPVQYQMPQSNVQSAPPSGSQATASGQSAAGEEKSDTQKEGNVVKSPIVGTFYRSPSPEDDAFVNIGDHVEKGQTICIVEAMKIMNEIESEYAGEVKKILVDDAEAVEFEQPLFIIG